MAQCSAARSAPVCPPETYINPATVSGQGVQYARKDWVFSAAIIQATTSHRMGRTDAAAVSKLTGT
jgi:hypothetical protein